MIILGVADCPDSAAALVVDGTLVAAVSQERIDRERHSRAFPSGAIDAVLDAAGVRARDVDRVVFGSSFSPSTLLRARPELLGRVTPRLREAYRGYQAALRKSGLYTVEQDISRKLLQPRIRALGFERAALDLLEHDRAHATAAYRCQERAEVLVVTLDTPGDGAAITVSVGRHLQLDRVFLQTALAAISTFPDRVARHLGIDPADLASLAAGGTAPPPLAAAFAREVGFDGTAFATRGMVADPDPLVALARPYVPADVAAAAQSAMEDAAVAFVRHWIERTRIGHVVVSGAIFANPRLCGRLLTEPLVETLAVSPAMGDEGLAIGAALGVAGTAMRRLPTLALGPSYTESQCYKALSVASLPRRKVDHPERTAADLIAAGRTVARFAGPMEFGAEALGGRSVLFRADDRALRARALAALQRQPWAAVGACTPTTYAPESYLEVERGWEAARFRSVALRATPAFARTHPGVVQDDGTALPQLVSAADTPDLAALLDDVRRRIGTPSLAHLGLHLGGEPLACSPGDAIRTWRASDVDALLLGPYLVERADASERGGG
jgi:carbamoyltransferase